MAGPVQGRVPAGSAAPQPGSTVAPCQAVAPWPPLGSQPGLSDVTDRGRRGGHPVNPRGSQRRRRRCVTRLTGGVALSPCTRRGRRARSHDWRLRAWANLASPRPVGSNLPGPPRPPAGPHRRRDGGGSEQGSLGRARSSDCDVPPARGPSVRQPAAEAQALCSLHRPGSGVAELTLLSCDCWNQIMPGRLGTRPEGRSESVRSCSIHDIIVCQ